MTLPLPIPELGDATLFPFAPDAEFPVTVDEEFLTDIMPGESGAEVRAACRSNGVRTLTFTVLFANEAELLAFQSRWLNATQPLRYFVPLWPEFASITGIAGAVVSADTTNRDFVEGGLAMLYYADPIGTDDRFELVTIDSFDDTSVTLDAPPVGNFPSYAGVPDGPSAIIPVMTAWVDPPAVDQLAITAERMTLTFREELPGIAGIDATVTEAVTAVADSIELSAWGVTQYEGTSAEPDQQFVWRAIVKDAAGVPIPNAPITWTVDPDEVDEPGGVRFTVSPDEQMARLELRHGFITANHSVTATSGSVSASANLVTAV